jgi:RNA polymerase sigma factor (sigma-70 family)
VSQTRNSDALPAAAAHTTRLSALFDAHENRLYRLARRLSPTIDDALDLVQETFLRAARTPGSIPTRSTDAEAWLVRVLVNIRRDQWRRETVRRRHVRELDPLPIPDNPEASFEIRSMVWKALDRLPPRRRAVVVMHEMDELDTASIASLLGISRITVRWHLAQGRRALARHLEMQSGDADDSPQSSFAGRRPAPSRPTAP